VGVLPILNESYNLRFVPRLSTLLHILFTNVGRYISYLHSIETTIWMTPQELSQRVGTFSFLFIYIVPSICWVACSISERLESSAKSQSWISVCEEHLKVRLIPRSSFRRWLERCINKSVASSSSETGCVFTIGQSAERIVSCCGSITCAI
jgi:hypothetical protein